MNNNGHIFDVEIIDGLVFLTMGGETILVDTGSPMTLHLRENLDFLGRTYPVCTGFGALDIEMINRHLPKRITTLLGIDILGQYQVEFAYRSCKIRFLDGPGAIEGEVVPFSGTTGFPVVDCSAGGRTISCYLDTGALYTYLPEEVVRKGRFGGVEHDFHPMLGGKFETPIYKHELSLGGMTFPACCGILPPLLQISLTLVGADGIMGYDLLKDHSVLFDLREGHVVVNKNR